MHFSKHQKQHFKQHNRKRANLFWAPKKDTISRGSIPLFSLQSCWLVSVWAARDRRTLQLVVEVLQQNSDDLND